MPNVLTIARRELRSYFDSPVAYILIVVFLLVAGWMFFSALFLIGRADLRGFFTPQVFSPVALLLVLLPALTMRLVAEERKTGTLELLTTMPLSDTQVVLGKFFAALSLVAAALLPTLAYAVSVEVIGDLDWGPVIAGYLGMVLFSAACLAIGMVCSCLTTNQINAFIIGFVVIAGLYFLYWLQIFLPAALGEIIEYVSLTSHLENMARGVIDTRDVLYYLTVTVGGLFLAERSLSRLHA